MLFANQSTLNKLYREQEILNAQGIQFGSGDMYDKLSSELREELGIVPEALILNGAWYVHTQMITEGDFINEDESPAYDMPANPSRWPKT